MMLNKKKIFNDPVYGFISIPDDLIFDIIEHPSFQRLRRIKQLGLAELVYPGALHTRFHHALGAMHLMGQAIETLRSKGLEISDNERQAAQIAILLHDIGHGPFSHVLESTLLQNIHHEQVSLLLMEQLNQELNGSLSLAIQMFANKYSRVFFYQMISSQLDMDRLDYLNRDCFFTGVSEGSIGSDRIIKMLNVQNNELVVEEKGIYSIENFLTARRLMYWQVYLHKTSICAETMLIQIIRRARQLQQANQLVFTTPALALFLNQNISLQQFKEQPQYLKTFITLDDFDIWACIKIWANHSDKLLAKLSQMLLDRKLYKIIFSEKPFDATVKQHLENELRTINTLPEYDLSYLLVSGSATNAAYLAGKQNIRILKKNGEIHDIATASDLPTIKALSKIVKKYYICWAKNVSL